MASKSAGGASSASKGPHRRESRRGPPKLDLFAQDDEPGGYHNPTLGDPEPSAGALRAGRKRVFLEEQPASVEEKDKIVAAAAASARVPAAVAAPQVLESVEAVLNKYKVCAYLAINKDLNTDRRIAHAIEKALKPAPKILNGDDEAQEAEALTKIITCEHQSSRAILVTALLKRGVRTWPPHGCQVGFTLRPPILAALEAYATFSEEEEEWDKMFDSLIQYGGNMDTDWGPLRVSASTEYYKLFKENHWSSRTE
jgi:hypothetical protein